MHFFSNLKVRTKLFFSYIILAIIIALIGFYASSSLQRVAENSQHMYQDKVHGVSKLKEININLIEIENDFLKLIYVKDGAAKSKLIDDIESSTSDIMDLVEGYQN